MCEYKRKTGNRKGGNTNKAPKSSREGRSTRHAADMLKVQVMGFSGLLRGVGF
jgi:hypothetical protein